MKKKTSGKLTNIVLVLIFLAGLSLLLYPTVSDYWNALHQTKAITTYAENVAALDNASYDAIWDAARAYNRNLLNRSNSFLLSQEQKAEYESLLDISGQGIMGYIEIPEIDVSLPIYHGTEDTVLQVAVGHLEWTSLPVGGESTHCVLSGHRGLPSAKLFTNLDQLEVGDTFTITVLDRVLTYEVDQISIVLPTETDNLKVVDGKDYVTLMTCTPYGINSHRLLVRGRRIETPDKLKHIRVTADAIKIEPIITAPIMALPLLLVLLLWLLFSNRKRKSTRGEKHETH